MKIFKSTRIIGAFVLMGMLMFSCDKFEEMNTNPNAPTDVPEEYVLPYILVNSAYTATYRTDQNVLNFWVQHWGAPNYLDEDWYQPRAATMYAVWAGLYSSTMRDCKHMIDKGMENEHSNMAAIGHIMKVWVAYTATNLWGMVPYSDAMAGGEEERNVTPTYDDQSAIYSSMISDLDAAIAMINPDGGDNPASFDLLFGGDMDMWSKFARAMKLRIYMQQTDVNPAAQSEVATMLDALPNFELDATFHFSSDAGNNNPNYLHLTSRTDDARMSKTLIDYMIGDNGTAAAPSDPRLPVYAADIDGEYVGSPNGVGGLGSSTSEVGFYTNHADAPYYFMSVAELHFIKAEAIARGWYNGDAEAAYRDAIAASMAQFGISSYDDATFFSDSRWAWDDGKALELIGSQKWVALFGQATVAYDNYRRTGYPMLEPSVDNNNNDLIPVRFFYPDEEYQTNSTNLGTAVASQGTDDINTRLWWDTQDN